MMTLVEKFIADNGGTAVDAIHNHGGLPEHWPPSSVFALISRMALEIARAEMERRKGM